MLPYQEQDRKDIKHEGRSRYRLYQEHPHEAPDHTSIKHMNMPPSRVDTPNYRVLQVIEVAPEVVTSSVDGNELHDEGQGSGSAIESFPLPPPEETPLPDDPRIVAMLRAPIPRREYRFTDQYIYVNYERFMRSVDPNWIPPPWVISQGTAQETAQEASRQPSSCLYTSISNRQGPVSCSERMSKWLDGLPVPKESTEAGEFSSPMPQDHQQRGGAEGSSLYDGMLPSPSRPRAQSTPVPFSISNNHLMEEREHRPGQSHPGAPTAPAVGPTTNLPGGSAIPGLHHPNPLGQHPIVLQELPIQLKIPKRKSSLHNNFQSSHPNYQPPAPSTTPAADDLIRGIDSIQLDNPIQFKDNQLDIERQDSAPDLQLDTQIGLGRRNTVACPQLLSRPGRDQNRGTPPPQLRSRLDKELRNSTPYPRIDQETVPDTFMGDAPLRFYDNANKLHDPAAHRRFSTHVNQLFGQDSGKTNHKKHARSEVSIFMSL